MTPYTEQEIQEVMKLSKCITRQGAISILKSVDNGKR